MEREGVVAVPLLAGVEAVLVPLIVRLPKPKVELRLLR